LDPNKVVWSLIGANAAVFMLWRVDPLFARQHFVVSLYSSVHRPWTILTSSISHADFGHFASNMVTLYFFGSSLGRVIGGQNVGLLLLLLQHSCV
jgi:membrane associated rhomboid family serine protease